MAFVQSCVTNLRRACRRRWCRAWVRRACAGRTAWGRPHRRLRSQAIPNFTSIHFSSAHHRVHGPIIYLPTRCTHKHNDQKSPSALCPPPPASQQGPHTSLSPRAFYVPFPLFYVSFPLFYVPFLLSQILTCIVAHAPTAGRLPQTSRLCGAKAKCIGEHIR